MVPFAKSHESCTSSVSATSSSSSSSSEASASSASTSSASPSVAVKSVSSTPAFSINLFPKAFILIHFFSAPSSLSSLSAFRISRSLATTQARTTSFFQRQDGQSRYGKGDTGKGNETFFSDLRPG